MGIVNHVVPQGELLAYCAAMANRMIKNAPLSIGMAKHAIYTGLDMDLDSALKLEASLFGLAFSTADKAEGMGAFLEKRKDTLGLAYCHVPTASFFPSAIRTRRTAPPETGISFLPSTMA